MLGTRIRERLKPLVAAFRMPPFPDPSAPRAMAEHAAKASAEVYDARHVTESMLLDDRSRPTYGPR